MSGIRDLSVQAYLDALSARSSTPGGGAVAAVVSAEAAGLMAMVAAFSKPDRCTSIESAAQAAIAEMLALADADADAFKAVMRAYRSGDTSEKQAALAEAAAVPARLAQICAGMVGDLRYLADEGNPNLITDVGIAAQLLVSALTACEMNIRINLRELTAAPTDIEAVLADLPHSQAAFTALSTEVAARL